MVTESDQITEHSSTNQTCCCTTL